MIPYIDKSGITQKIGKMDWDTRFQGYIYIAYPELVKQLGLPNQKPLGYKIDAIWAFMTPSGIVTLYNYMDGHSYSFINGKDVEDITTWHVGGKNPSCVKWLTTVLKKKTYKLLPMQDYLHSFI